MPAILTYLGFAKYAIPVFDAIVTEIKAALPTEKADVVAAYEAVEKAFVDFKSALEVLIAAVKTAIANS